MFVCMEDQRGNMAVSLVLYASIMAMLICPDEYMLMGAGDDWGVALSRQRSPTHISRKFVGVVVVSERDVGA